MTDIREDGSCYCGWSDVMKHFVSLGWYDIQKCYNVRDIGVKVGSLVIPRSK